MDLKEIKIKKPKQEDFVDVYLLLKQLWPEKKIKRKVLEKVFYEGLKSTAEEYLVAWFDDVIIGFVSIHYKNSLWQEGMLAHIDEMVVDEDYREKGVGTLLLDECLKIVVKKKCLRIEVDSALKRLDAHRFYKSKNFENRAYLFSRELDEDPTR
jgi:glucosamine-phosphate N-acetyltransferase